MRCNCNPCQAEFGQWRGVRRCAVCGKVFHAGWKCRPKCEPSTEEICRPEIPPDTQIPPAEDHAAAAGEECPPECEPPIEQQCPPECFSIMDDCPPFEDEYLPEPETPAVEEPVEEEPTEKEPELEPIARQGEWTRVLPTEGAQEVQGWPLSDLTDQLPPDPH